MRRSRLSFATLAIASVIVSLTVTPVHAAENTARDTAPDTVWAPPGDAAALTVPEDRQIPEDSWAPLDEDRFSSSDSSTQMRAPAGTVAGAPGVGELPWFSFQDFAVASDSTVRVNIANGNVLVKANESTIAVPGFGLRQDRFYNGLWITSLSTVRSSGSR